MNENLPPPSWWADMWTGLRAMYPMAGVPDESAIMYWRMLSRYESGVIAVAIQQAVAESPQWFPPAPFIERMASSYRNRMDEEAKSRKLLADNDRGRHEVARLSGGSRSEKVARAFGLLAVNEDALYAARHVRSEDDLLVLAQAAAEGSLPKRPEPPDLRAAWGPKRGKL